MDFSGFFPFVVMFVTVTFLVQSFQASREQSDKVGDDIPRYMLIVFGFGLFNAFLLAVAYVALMTFIQSI
jgi:hypothetical protein